MQAGIAVYQRQGDQLVGQWSHEDIGGALADEIVHGVAAGALEGEWPVDIFAPTGEIFFRGRLRSTKFGKCLRLEWEGSFVNDGAAARFEGIGHQSGSDFLSATFEQVDNLPSLPLVGESARDLQDHLP